jgi:hypothetical protein
MSNDVWRSRDDNIISDYAERLQPTEQEDEQGIAPATTAPPNQTATGKAYDVDFRYDHSVPARDLLNYKNMDLEMSLWAKTNTGWMSVFVLIVLMFICFALTWVAWIIRT